MALTIQATCSVQVRGDGTHASISFDYRQVPAVFSTDAGPTVVVPSVKPTDLTEISANDVDGVVAVSATLHNFTITLHFAVTPPADHLVNVTLTLLWSG